MKPGLRGGKYRHRNELRAVLVEDPIEHFYQLEHANIEACLFPQLPCYALRQGFAEFKRPAGDRPFAAQRLRAAPDQQHPALFDQHSADADHRPRRKFP
ncbi:MAG TPA: hypothetical protein VHE23_00750 [Candidatus Acidoferrales bacterium]|nr:hypothetical protein [Candidatus Acidoferrales bacterium]